MVLARRLLSLALLCGCYPPGFAGAQLYRAPSDFPFQTGPYLVRVSPTTMAVVMRHELTRPPVVTWWRGSPTSERTPVVATAHDGVWIALLEDLPAGEDLTYRVDCEAGEAGPFAFRADIARGQPFRFAAFGDTRTGHEVHRDVVDALARENIAFVIHSGDLVEFGGVVDQWDLFFRIESPLMSRTPMFAAVGNHDNSARNNFRRFFATHLYAGDRRYYYQDWGDVRVVTLDSEIELRAGSAQYTFVESALREAAEQDMLILMSLHYPPWSSGQHGSNLEMRAVLGELAPRFGVEVVLAGHDHNYERTKVIDGVTYIVAASAGATIRNMAPQRFSVAFRTEPHYVLFDVERGTLVGRAVNLNGDVFDSFVIPPNPPRPRSGTAEP